MWLEPRKKETASLRRPPHANGCGTLRCTSLAQRYNPITMVPQHGGGGAMVVQYSIEHRARSHRGINFDPLLIWYKGLLKRPWDDVQF